MHSNYIKKKSIKKFTVEVPSLLLVEYYYFYYQKSLTYNISVIAMILQLYPLP